MNMACQWPNFIKINGKKRIAFLNEDKINMQKWLKVASMCTYWGVGKNQWKGKMTQNELLIELNVSEVIS